MSDKGTAEFIDEVLARLRERDLEPTKANIRQVESALLIERGNRILSDSSAGVTMTAAAQMFSSVAMQEFHGVLEELMSLGNPTPAQLRRIAELTEIVHDEEAARTWWEQAATAGDEDAIEMVELLRAEGGEA